MALETGRHEQRRFPRIQLSVPARFLLSDDKVHTGTLLDISAGGLALTTDERPEIGTHVVVYLDEVGRVEGYVVRHLDGGFAVEFDATDAKRERLSARLTWIASRSDGDAANSCDSNAEASAGPRFILPDGREIECHVLDMSVHSVWLSVGVRPPIGEEVTIGRMRGKVRRHNPAGIEIEFLRP